MNNAKHALANASLIASLCIAAPLAAAAEYVVQIGAFKYPPSSAINTLGSYGEILEQPTPSGLTRILVGTFNSHGEATGIRDQLRDQGYPDAFITRYGGSESAYVGATATSDYNAGDEAAFAAAKSTAPAAGGSSTSTMAGLSDEEKLRAVFLDGQLKMKVGSEFLSLDDYRAKY